MFHSDAISYFRRFAGLLTRLTISYSKHQTDQYLVKYVMKK